VRGAHVRRSQADAPAPSGRQGAALPCHHGQEQPLGLAPVLPRAAPSQPGTSRPLSAHGSAALHGDACGTRGRQARQASEYQVPAALSERGRSCAARRGRQGRARGRLTYVLLAALAGILLVPFYGGMLLYHAHATCARAALGRGAERCRRPLPLRLSAAVCETSCELGQAVGKPRHAEPVAASARHAPALLCRR